MSKSAVSIRKARAFSENIMLELALNKDEKNENKVTVAASLTPIERKKFNDLAKMIGLSPSSLMRSAARRTLREAREAGIIPTFEAAP